MKLSSSILIAASLATAASAVDCNRVTVTITSTRTLLQAFTTLVGTTYVTKTNTPPVPTITSTIGGNTVWNTVYNTISDLLEVTPTTYVNQGPQTVTSTITCNPTPPARMVKRGGDSAASGPQTLIRQVRKRQEDCGTVTSTITSDLYKVWYTQPIYALRTTTVELPTPAAETVTITQPATTKTTTIPLHVPKYWTTRYLGSTRYFYVYLRDGQVVPRC